MYIIIHKHKILPNEWEWEVPLTLGIKSGSPLDETVKPEFPCQSRCSTIKIPSSSKGVVQRSKFRSPSLAMATSKYKRTT